jgi:hypothetical protein
LWEGFIDDATEKHVSEFLMRCETTLCLPGRLVGAATLFACKCDCCGKLLAALCLFLDNVCFSEPKILLRDSIVDVRRCVWKAS